MVQKSNNGSNGRRARKADATRGAILRAAAGVFRQRGFADTGMREIAAAADLSPGNLYYYFKSKADILFFCQDHSVGRMLHHAADLEKSGLAPAERLRRMIVAHMLCTLDELDGAAAHTEVDALPAALRKRIVAKRDRYEKAIRRIVAEGARTGAFTGTDPVLATRAILGALNWTTRWYKPDGKLQPQQVADAFADYLVRGLSK